MVAKNFKLVAPGFFFGSWTNGYVALSQEGSQFSGSFILEI